MAKLYTLTLNPALDLSLEVQKLSPNEKNPVIGEDWEPGGGGINAARILHRLGMPVVVFGFLGGPTGQKLRRLLKKEGVQNRFVEVRGETRMNISISNLHDHLQTRLSLKGAAVSETDWRRLQKMLKSIPSGSLVIVAGSFPPQIKIGAIHRLLDNFRQRDIGLILDVPGDDHGRLSKGRAFLIKPNLAEFQKMLNTKGKTIPTVLHLVRKKLSSIPLVCVSSVEGGALLISRDAAWFGKIPPMRLRSTVGAGDSLVGAMTAEIARLRLYEVLKKDLQSRLSQCGENLLRRGLAASAATLMQSGTRLGVKRDMLLYLPKIKIRRID